MRIEQCNFSVVGVQGLQMLYSEKPFYQRFQLRDPSEYRYSWDIYHSLICTNLFTIIVITRNCYIIAIMQLEKTWSQYSNYK